MRRVLLTAGFSRANHVLTLAELLRREDVEVCGVLVVSPYGVKRFKRFYRQRGMKGVVRAAGRMAGLVKGSGTSTGGDALEELMDVSGIPRESVPSWARRHGVDVQTVSGLNSDDAVAFVEECDPDAVVYGGGGILRAPFIAAAKYHVLNAHSGPLPEIRGMNACEWSLLLGYQPEVTIHFIDTGIDTGGIVRSSPVPVEPGDTVDRLRSKCVVEGVLSMRDVILQGDVERVESEQDAASHRQCFVMAPALREVLDAKLMRAWAPD